MITLIEYGFVDVICTVKLVRRTGCSSKTLSENPKSLTDWRDRVRERHVPSDLLPLPHASGTFTFLPLASGVQLIDLQLTLSV